MNSQNLELWHSVEKTDPSQTKTISGKPYKGTSPKPYFLIHEATKAFGPCGISWGFKILNERVEEGAPGDKVHIAHVQVWYEWGGKRGEIEHVGQTMFAGKNKNGAFTDEDAPKKSVTDALIKALSMIGFAGDIFMGRYDDSKYAAEVRQEFEEKANPPRDMTIPLKAAEASLVASAKEGLEALKKTWVGLDPDLRQAFGTVTLQRFKDIATAADQTRKAA